MDFHQKDVQYFVKADGRIPFKDWVKNCDAKVRTIIYSRFTRLERGLLGDHKALGHKLYELRIHFGPGYRIYFGEDGPVMLLILCGGNKSSQNNDILKAQNFWADYHRRKK